MSSDLIGNYSIFGLIHCCRYPVLVISVPLFFCWRMPVPIFVAICRVSSLLPIVIEKIFGDILKRLNRIVRRYKAIPVRVLLTSIAFTRMIHNAIGSVFVQHVSGSFGSILSYTFVWFFISFVYKFVRHVRYLSLSTFFRWCQFR